MIIQFQYEDFNEEFTSVYGNLFPWLTAHMVRKSLLLQNLNLPYSSN